MNDNAKAQQILNYVQGNTVKQDIFRGLENLSEADYSKYTTIGTIVNFKGLDSWTTDKSVAVSYGKNGNAVVFIKQTPTQNARSIGNKAGTGTEKEVIANNFKGKISKVEKEQYGQYRNRQHNSNKTRQYE